MTRERWDAEDILRDAVLYRMLLLGEIASALPDDLRDSYPEVAWRQIRAFRNLAVHKYFGVDWAVVWKITQAEYPALAQSYELGPAPDPGTASLPDHGSQDLPREGAAATACSLAVKIHDAKVEPPLPAGAPRPTEARLVESRA